MHPQADDPRLRARFAGCFAPDEVALLERVLDEATGEAMRMAMTSQLVIDSEQMRSSLASAIVTAAATGARDPERLKAAALAAVGAAVKAEPRPTPIG